MKLSLINKNLTLFSILLFLIFFFILNITKPSFLYNNDGSLRVFGIGQKRKTILPVWLLTIVLAILCYLLLLYLITLPKFR